MRVSEQAMNIVKQFEGLRLKAYLCPAGVLTIGYGCTADVREGETITEAEADARLTDDLKAAYDCIADWVDVDLSDNEAAALASFIFNLGCGAFRGSTLLKLLNSGADKGAVAAQFLRWNKAQGKVLPGLTRRREAERDLFLA